MRCRLDALCIEAHDPPALAGFWSALLGWPDDLVATASGPPTLVPDDDTGFRLRFLATDEPKTLPNQMHFDLTSNDGREQDETVRRALELGATHLDVGQLAEEGHVVLADPEGNVFCVIEAGNSFLADCGFIGALASDGSPEVGHFWSRTLGWPLVWDQDEETAVRSPLGGPKVTWGGPPYDPKPARNRWHFDLVPVNGCDRDGEVDRLVSLGARVVGLAEGPKGEPDDRVLMVDPDGNHFCVL